MFYFLTDSKIQFQFKIQMTMHFTSLSRSKYLDIFNDEGNNSGK